MKSLAFLVAAALVACSTQPAADKAAPTSSYAAVIDRLSDEEEFNGIALVAHGEDILFEEARGLANVDPPRKMTTEHASRIASVTKQFTAATILRLMEQGMLSLDDTVADHLPQFAGLPAEKVTIAQLLNHSGGLPRPERGDTKETFRTSADDRMQGFMRLPLDFAPGTQHSYSNSGYTILGAIIEKTTGKEYAAAVTEILLTPLGLSETAAVPDGAAHPMLASDLSRDTGQLTQDDYRVSDRGAPWSAGMLVSTPRDLLAWTRKLHSGAVFQNSATFELMLMTPGGWEENRAFDNWAYASGLFRVRRDNGRAFWFHDGRLGSYLADVRYYPEEDLTIVVLETANGDVTASANALEDYAFSTRGAQ